MVRNGKEWENLDFSSVAATFEKAMIVRLRWFIGAALIVCDY